MFNMLILLTLTAAAVLLCLPRKQQSSELDRIKKICTDAVIERRNRAAHQQRALASLTLHDSTTEKDRLKAKYFAMPLNVRISPQGIALAKQIQQQGGRVWARNDAGQVEYLDFKDA